MFNIIEVAKVERIIHDLEIRLKTLQISLDDVQKEVWRLESQKIFLEENVVFLKNKAIVTSTAEFKKIKEDLIAVKSRLAMFYINKNNHEKAKRQFENDLKTAKDTHVKLTTVEENNVYFPKFGGPDGQE